MNSIPKPVPIQFKGAFKLKLLDLRVGLLNWIESPLLSPCISLGDIPQSRTACHNGCLLAVLMTASYKKPALDRSSLLPFELSTTCPQEIGIFFPLENLSLASQQIFLDTTGWENKPIIPPVAVPKPGR